MAKLGNGVAAVWCSLSVFALAACGGGGGTSHSSAVPPGPGSSPQAETARQADAFVDSVGLNIHLGYYGTLYGSNYARIEALLTGLGVRHVRDGVYVGAPNLCTEFVQLAALGIHGDFIVAPTDKPTDITTWDACTGGTADAYEGLNEYDTAHLPSDTNWAQTVSLVQQTLATTVRAMRPVTVIAPSLSSEAAYAAAGSLSATSDVGNMHVYFAGRNPGTTGWGAGSSFGVYGSLSYDIALAKVTTGAKPIYSTENGYRDTIGSPNGVPAATKARYLLRSLFEQWNAGVVRTYLYELVDEGADGSYGLTDGGGTPKPAYVAVKNVLAHLSDPGAAGAAGSLTYAIAGPTNIHHSLFQKHDGSFVVALWLEVPEWDPVSNTPITVARQPVTVTFANAPSTLQTTTFDDAGNVTTQPTAVTGTSLTLQVGGSPVLLDVKP